MHRAGIPAAGEGGVGAVVEAVEQVERLAGNHDDRPGGPEARAPGASDNLAMLNSTFTTYDVANAIRSISGRAGSLA